MRCFAIQPVTTAVVFGHTQINTFLKDRGCDVITTGVQTWIFQWKVSIDKDYCEIQRNKKTKPLNDIHFVVSRDDMR